MSSALDVVRIRPGKKEDCNFIVDSWLESYRSSKWARDVPGPIYYPEHRARIADALRSSAIFVACDRTVDDQLAGYSVYDGSALHYVYVKAEMRRYGIARELILPCIGVVKVHTHETSGPGTWKLRTLARTKFNPYLF